jgi:hypothetical protein
LDASSKTVITLVHGTWARRAKWVRPGSRLRTLLNNHLPGTVLFEVFTWGGRNSARTRQLASEKLALQLSQQLLDYPDAQHFVLGHSHGGSVALKAVEIAGLFHSVGVICMSTPFFAVSPRNYGGLREGIAILLGIWVNIQLLCLFFGSRIIPGSRYLDLLSIVITLALVVLVGFALVRWRESAWKKGRLFHASAPPGARLMVIRTNGDEASSVIAAFQFGAWLLAACVRIYLYVLGAIHEASEAFVNRHDKTPGWKVVTFVLLAMALTFCAAFIWVDHPFGNLVSKLIAFVLWGPILYVLLLLVAYVADLLLMATLSCLLPFVIGIIVLPVLPIGFDLALISLFFQVSVESVPVGKWRVHQFATPPGEFLSHSAAHDDPNVIGAIQRWIVNQD